MTGRRSREQSCACTTALVPLTVVLPPLRRPFLPDRRILMA
jgi:hypothetical protein